MLFEINGIRPQGQILGHNRNTLKSRQVNFSSTLKSDSISFGQKQPLHLLNLSMSKTEADDLLEKKMPEFIELAAKIIQRAHNVPSDIAPKIVLEDKKQPDFARGLTNLHPYLPVKNEIHLFKDNYKNFEYPSQNSYSTRMELFGDIAFGYEMFMQTVDWHRVALFADKSKVASEFKGKFYGAYTYQKSQNILPDEKFKALSEFTQKIGKYCRSLTQKQYALANRVFHSRARQEEPVGAMMQAIEYVEDDIGVDSSLLAKKAAMKFFNENVENV